MSCHISNFKAIVSGFANWAFPSETYEKLAKVRAEICSKCEHANPNHPFKFLLEDGNTKEVSGMGCNLCHCLLSAKVRQTINSCPESKW